MTRTILHVDMDAFFAAVEQRDDPSLRGKPVVVGGPSRRGVVAAASYEARRFGIHSAMPMVEALRRCPEAIVVSGQRGRYSEVSGEIFAIFERYTPLVEGLSLDEAFLDVTESRRLHGDGLRIARAIKRAIRDELGLVASAGVAPVKFVAKIASDLKKPDGLVVVAPEEVESFLAPLPIERMWGVGKVAAARLHEAGFATLGDLAQASPDRLERLLGSWGRAAHELARGIDPRPVVPEREAKSIGSEATYEVDIRERAGIERELLRHAEMVARRLVASERKARGVTIKLKDRYFRLHTAHERLSEGVHDATSLYRAACRALDRLGYDGMPTRLVGLAATDLGEHDVQGQLFPDPELERRTRLESIVVRANERFGDGALGRAAASPSPRRRPRR